MCLLYIFQFIKFCVSFCIFILKTELVKTYAHCQNAETMNQILYLRKF
jgi:hypothetical protein